MRRLIWVLEWLAVGGILLPLAAYLAGTRGFASYLSAIYADAAVGHPLALQLLLAPLACAGAWALRNGWWRRYRTRMAAQEAEA